MRILSLTNSQEYHFLAQMNLEEPARWAEGMLVQGWVQAGPGLSGGADRTLRAWSLGEKGVSPRLWLSGPSVDLSR